MEHINCPSCGKEVLQGMPFCPHCGEKLVHLNESDYSKNPFQILQVSPEAEIEVIEAAYRSLAKKYHPDIDQSESAQEKMGEINWAYGILKDDKRRKEWLERAKRKPTQNTESPKTTFSQTPIKPEEPINNIVRCPKCRNYYAKNLSECPFCKKTVKANVEGDHQRRFAIFTGLAILMLCVCGLWFYGDYIFSPELVSSNSQRISETRVALTRWAAQTKVALKTPIVTSTLRKDTTSIMMTNRAVQTNAANSGLFSGTSNCIKWSQVGAVHVGKQNCVYGRVVKIMFNDYGNGFGEYVVRFKSTDDYFLVKSENYWWPDLKEGQCWYFIGVIQNNGTYYFMKMVTGGDVEGGSYSPCD